MTGVAAFALLLAGYALIANRLDKLSIGPALAFVVVGLVLGPAVLDLLPVDAESITVQHLAEVTLALVLFTDASAVDLAGLRRDASLIGRLLGIGLLLTIAAGGLAATLIFPELPLPVALLIAAILAPTDAALGLPVITNKAVPTRVRRILNVESGLNDGIATPFVLLFIALATAAGGAAGGHLQEAIVEIAIAVVVGIAVGGVGGFLLAAADERRLTSELSRQIVVLALAVGGYFASVAVGGNGFIAAFLAGLAFGAVTRRSEEGAELFAETTGILLSIAVWTIFGAAFVGSLVSDLGNLRPLLYAVISLTVVRMVPAAIALVGSGLALPTVAFIGWFGPRGLASIVFGILAVDALGEARAEVSLLAATIAWTVLLSIVAHGVTAEAFAIRYGRWIASREAAGAKPLPEVEERSELRPATRSTWNRRQDPAGGTRR